MSDKQVRRLRFRLLGEQPPHQFLLFASAVGLDAPSFDPAFVFSAQNIGDKLETGIKIQAIKRPCPGWDASKKFYPVSVTIRDATGNTGPSDDQSIIAQCGVNPTKHAPVGVLSAVMQRDPQLSLIWIHETTPGAHAIRVIACSASDCRDTWRQLTAPYRQQWQAFIDDTKARTTSWQLDVDTRITPLIAAERASVRAAAMRLGETYRPRVAPPSSAPVKPKTPVRKRK